MRILFYTHRFGKDLVGGAETHLWNLAEKMARMGCRVDVATTLQSDLSTIRRFGERWSDAQLEQREVVEIKGAPHPMEIHRFPVRNLPRLLGLPLQKILQRRWENEELALEPNEPFSIPFESRAPLLLTGWHTAEQRDDGKNIRWTMPRAAIQLPETEQSALHVQGYAPRQTTIMFERQGRQRVVFRGKGDFQINIQLEDCPCSTVAVFEFSSARRPWSDTRVLGARISQISLSSRGQIHLAPLHVDHRALRAYDKKQFIETYMRRAQDRPRFFDWLFDRLRGPRCPGMERFLKKNHGRYTWVLAGVLPFATLPSAARLRRKTPFRLACLPLFHADDDFFYWRHYLDALREADICLANSRFSNEEFFPVVGAKSFEAGAGVDETIFRKSSIDGDRFRKRLGIGPEEKIVLSVGRKSGTKLYRTLAKAVHNIQHRVKCRFILAGSDEDLRSISYPSCTYLGVIDMDVLLDAYDACDVFCLMSESESFGLAFIEAWMREKPVIGNRNCAPVANLIRDGVNGYLVSRRAELEDRLVELLENPERCAEFGRAGMEKVLRSHTWKAVARRVLDRLETIEKM